MTRPRGCSSPEQRRCGLTADKGTTRAKGFVFAKKGSEEEIILLSSGGFQDFWVMITGVEGSFGGIVLAKRVGGGGRAVV